MLTNDEAASIARQHGLTVHDAVSLRMLADDKAEANEIAAKFATTDEKQFVRDLFGGSASHRTVTVTDLDDEGKATPATLRKMFPN
jgi:hypothetical protein